MTITGMRPQHMQQHGTGTSKVAYHASTAGQHSLSCRFRYVRAFSDRVGAFFLGLMARVLVVDSVVREPCESQSLDH